MSDYRPRPRKGQVLGWSPFSEEGAIAGQDGNRYTFHRSEWKDEIVQPERGIQVDFLADGNRAIEIYPALEQPQSFSATQSQTTQTTRQTTIYPTKSRITAGVLAILLGGFGIHKFYLGFKGPGFLLLVLGIIGLVTIGAGIGVVIWLGLCVVVVIEAVNYLTKSQQEFHEIYVVNRKKWF